MNSRASKARDGTVVGNSNWVVGCIGLGRIDRRTENSKDWVVGLIVV